MRPTAGRRIIRISAANGVYGRDTRFLGRHHAEALQRQLDKGGILLWVRTADSKHETRALEVLKATGGEDVHLHTLPKVSFGEKLEIYGYLDWLAGAPRPRD